MKMVLDGKDVEVLPDNEAHRNNNLGAVVIRLTIPGSEPACPRTIVLHADRVEALSLATGIEKTANRRT